MGLLIKFDVKNNASKEAIKLKRQLHDLNATTATATSKMGGLSKSLLGLAGTMYTMNKAYDLTILRGVKYNNLIENQRNSIATLINVTSSNVSSMGKQLSYQEKMNLSLANSNKLMEELTKINANTPQTLGQTAQIFKTMYAPMQKVGASQKDMLILTEKLAIASKVGGVQFNSLLAGVDGLATGTVLANSDLGRFLSSLGLTNKKIKESKDVIGLLKSSLSDFKAFDDLDTAVSNLNVQWDTLTGNLTKDIFSQAKTSAKGLVGILEQVNRGYKIWQLESTEVKYFDVDSLKFQRQYLINQRNIIKNDKFMWDSRQKSKIKEIDNALREISSRMTKVFEEQDTLQKKATENTNQLTAKKPDSLMSSAITSSLSDWEEYYFKLEEYETSFHIKKAQLINKYGEEHAKKLYPQLIKEFNDSIGKGNKSLGIDLDISGGISTAITSGINGSNLNDIFGNFSKSLGSSLIKKGTDDALDSLTADLGAVGSLGAGIGLSFASNLASGNSIFGGSMKTVIISQRDHMAELVQLTKTNNSLLQSSVNVRVGTGVDIYSGITRGIESYLTTRKVAATRQIKNYNGDGDGIEKYYKQVSDTRVRTIDSHAKIKEQMSNYIRKFTLDFDDTTSKVLTQTIEKSKKNWIGRTRKWTEYVYEFKSQQDIYFDAFSSLYDDFNAEGIHKLNEQINGIVDFQRKLGTITLEDDIASQKEYLKTLEGISDAKIDSLTVDNFKDFVSVDSLSAIGVKSVVDLGIVEDAFENYFDLLTEANKGLDGTLQETTNIIKGFVSSIDSAIKTIRGNSFESGTTSSINDLIEQYNTSLANGKITEASSLATSISGTAFGDTSLINQSLIESLNNAKLHLGLEDEILNVNIVSSDLLNTQKSETLQSTVSSSPTSTKTKEDVLERIEKLLTTISISTIKSENNIEEILETGITVL